MQFFRKIIFISSYTEKNNYFLLYELIQDLPYLCSHETCHKKGKKNLVFVVDLNPVYFDSFSHTDTYINDGTVHYIF